MIILGLLSGGMSSGLDLCTLKRLDLGSLMLRAGAETSNCEEGTISYASVHCCMHASVLGLKT